MSEDRATLSEELPDWPSLYDKTGNILDVNTLLVNVGELRAAFRTAVEAAILKERERAAAITDGIRTLDEVDAAVAAIRARK